MRYLAVLLAMVATGAYAGVTFTVTTEVNLLRSGLLVKTLNSWDACEVIAKELGGKITSGTTKFTCQTERRQIVATYTAVNRPPTISGIPAATVVAGQAYSFQPTASDPDGDKLSFSIVNKPAWAQFDATTGRLSGTPTAANDGFHAGLSITVSDGKASASTPEFSITVQLSTVPTTPTTPAVGTASLTWGPPTLKTDGSALNDLAGYWIYYGQSPNVLSQTIQVPNAGATAYAVPNLSTGAWYFGIRAYNTSGATSDLSNIVSKTVR